jgi:excisionase family DNA binding protein
MRKLTTTEVAQRLGVGKSTVNLWCNQGRFPHAESIEESRGPVWLIPESDLAGFVKPTQGRPPKPASAAKRATGQKNASDGPSSKKKGRKK